IGAGQGAQVPCTIDAARLDQDILGFAAISAGVHAQRATDAAGNAAVELEARNTGIAGGAGQTNVEHTGSGAQTMAGLDADLAEAVADPDHHTRNAAIADNDV